MREILDNHMTHLNHDVAGFDLSKYSLRLQKNEKILWGGKRKFVRNEEDTNASLFFGGYSLIFGAFLLFLAKQSDADESSAFFYMPFIIIGLFIIIGFPIINAFQVKSNKYIITNQRIHVLMNKKKGGIFPAYNIYISVSYTHLTLPTTPYV